MSNSPSVILDFRGYSYNDKSNENCFYRCHSTKNILSYITRNNAINSSKKAQILEEIRLEVNLNSKHREGNILGYMKNRTGSTGLFNENGEMSKTSKEQFEKQLASTKSIVWAGVVSFTPDFASQICKNKNDAQQLIAENIKYLFKGSHINPDNINWCGAFHTNTDNPHIHITMFEKQPLHINSNGKNSYSKKIEINPIQFDSFKFNITKNIVENKISFYNLRDETRQGFAQSLGNDKYFLNLFYNNCKDIVENGKFQYNRLDIKQQKKVNNYVKFIINSNEKLKNDYSNYKNNLLKEQANIFSIFNHNKSKPSKEAVEYFSSRFNDLNTRLANEFLKTLKNFHNEKTPYLNFKSSLSAKTIKTSMLMRKKSFLDVTISTATNFLNNLTVDMQQQISNISVDAYLYNKIKKGEKVYE